MWANEVPALTFSSTSCVLVNTSPVLVIISTVTEPFLTTGVGGFGGITTSFLTM